MKIVLPKFICSKIELREDEHITTLELFDMTKFDNALDAKIKIKEDPNNKRFKVGNYYLISIESTDDKIF